MAGGYIPLPAYQVPRNALLDFSGLDSGLDTYRQGVEQAYKGQTNRLIGDYLTKGDTKGATSAAFSRGDLQTGMQVGDYAQKQDDRLKQKVGQAMLLALQKPEGKARNDAVMQVVQLNPNWQTLGPQYQHPDTAALAVLADANMAGDYLNFDMKRRAAAIQAAQEARAAAKSPLEMEALRTSNAMATHNLEEAQNPALAYQRRAQIAPKYGLQEGTPEFKAFVFNGKLPDHSGKLGLNTIWGTDKDGKPVIIQPSTTGVAAVASLPEGVSVTPPTKNVDLGTSVAVLGRDGRVTTSLPKDVAGHASAEEVGKAQGKAIADLPTIQGASDRMLGQIDAVLNDPNLKGVTGGNAYMPTLLSRSRDTQARIAQLQGGAFLQAFNTLRGGGQITEVEGAKATNALARLTDLTQTDSGYRQALQDFRNEIIRLTAIAKQRAGGGAPQAPTPTPTRQRARNPQTGETVEFDGTRWVPVQ